MSDLPDYVTKETTRHGKIVYYFRRRKGAQRIRLPEPSSSGFREAYEAAFSGEVPPLNEYKTASQHEEDLRRLRVLVALRSAIRQARNRARRKAVPFNLTDQWAFDQAAEQAYKCVLTGVPFYREFKGRTKHHPYAPSLDRIEPAKGYVIGNVRIVIFAMNMAMADWGEAVVREAFKKPLTPQRGLIARTLDTRH